MPEGQGSRGAGALRQPGRIARLSACTLIFTLALAFSSAAGAARYLVVYKGENVPKNAAATIQAAGGQLVVKYDDIGVALADSSLDSFSTALAADSKVDGLGDLSGLSFGLEHDSTDWEGELPNVPATDADTFSPLQWDMRQIHAPEAHAVTGGSPEVIVGDIDTGIDARHPDLRQNVSDENSVNCLGGDPVPGATAADDDNGHGTHTAGTIAAAANGIGVVGVAPDVKVAGIKAGDADGFFFPEAVICGFVWAGSHHLDVTNNSYFADPWEYNCRNDKAQQSIWKAEQRAIMYAQNQGVTVVAAAGNDSDDLSHPTTDVTSPDFPPGSEQERRVTN